MGTRFNVGRGFAILIANLALLAALLGLVWAGGETYYRYVFDSTDSFGLTKVSGRWFVRHYHENAMGARDDIEYSLERLDSRRRISFLGDSFTAGHGIAEVRDRFANRIRNAYPTRFEVHVLADTGNDTGKEVDLIHQLVARGYELDVLVLVYVLNDISDIVPEWSQTLDRLYRTKGHEGFPFEQSYFANVLFYRWKAIRDPDISNYYSFLQSAYDREDLWSQQEQRLASLRDFCAAQDAQLLVVTFPLLHALGPAYSYRSVHERLAELWSRLSVPHLDLSEVYAGHAPQKLAIGKYDAHPNRFAHELAANSIGPFLEATVKPRTRHAQPVDQIPRTDPRRPGVP
jgi:hypothetical protein